jgi:hypothetical protein
MRIALALWLVVGCGSPRGDRAHEPSEPAVAPTTRADPPTEDRPIDDRAVDVDLEDDAPDDDAVPYNAAREHARETARTAGAVGMLEAPAEPATSEIEPGSFAHETDTARIEVVIRTEEDATRDAVLAVLGSRRGALERCGVQGLGTGTVTLTVRNGHVVAFDQTHADGLPRQGECVREVIRHARFAPDASGEIEAVITIAARAVATDSPGREP